MNRDPKAQRKALMKPFEVIAISAGAGIFVALIIILTLENWLMAVIIGFGIMVVVLLVLALLLLGYKPNPDVPIFLDRELYESEEPGARDSSLRIDPNAHGKALPREEREDDGPQ